MVGHQEENIIIVDNIKLDSQQKNIVLDNSKYLLVVAGAGSGKTLTIIAKINYLIEVKKINPKDILCISFTNETINDLKRRISFDVEVYTFHKLALQILKSANIQYNIAASDYLEFIIEEFFTTLIYQFPYLIKNLVLLFSPWSIFNYINAYKNIDKTKINKLKKNIHRYISLFKANNFNDESFFSFYHNSKFINKLLLPIIYAIYLIYENELSSTSSIDFDDMINLATEFIEKNELNRIYRYIIIDEFQDSSYSRLMLIKKLVEKCNSKLMVVGDDFQSIYRFTGCDLDIFINFDQYFINSKKLFISNTYRNSQQLVDIAGKFIMQNKNQISKKLLAQKSLEKPIKIIYTNNYKKSLEKLIMKINTNDILILGRNNYDINNYLNRNFIIDNSNITYLKNKDLKLRYLTVHRSKGLEASNVILINLEDKIDGFPNKMIDSKILKDVLNTKEIFPFEEERRLFYVAITRTKNYTYLLCDKSRESIFIKELRKKYANLIEIITDK